jgi:hypothetical protein
VGDYSEPGASLSWALADAVSGGPARALRAIVRALPAHPANAVKVLYSVAGGPEREVRGHATGIDPASGAQMFSVDLPVPPDGLAMVWRPVLMRSGRMLDPRLGGIPADIFRTAIPPAAASAAPPALPQTAAVVPVHPDRFPFLPQFLFRVTASFLPDDSPVGETPDGLRFLFALQDGGTVRGPALNGAILHKGGDWMRVRRDGVGICAIDALIRPTGGGVVLTEYTGVCDFGPQGYAALARGALPGKAPLRFAPRYLTAVPGLQWMNRLQCLSIGEVDLERRVIEYDLYAFGPIAGLQ